MPGWNLSVDMRAHASDLIEGLRNSAKAARSLSRDSLAAQRRLTSLGAAGQHSARQLRNLGTDAQWAARQIRMLVADSGRAGAEMRTLARVSQEAGREQRQAGEAVQRTATHMRGLVRAGLSVSRSQEAAARSSRTAVGGYRTLGREIRSTARDMQALALRSATVGTRLRSVGRDGERAMGRFATASGRVRSQLGSLTALLAGGGLLLGMGAMVKEGNEFQKEMNTFGAVTGATAAQMRRASATAQQMGDDLKLPSSTAADAAAAMVELAKAGFRTDQAIDAVRSSLVLSTAGNLNAADSAKFLGDMMDQFGMGADQAAKAADILAATANAASGDIVDIYYAMKYAGPVAHGLGVSMQEAATGVGMLGKAGILGQTAGTTLRGMLTNMAKPTDQMAAGLKTLNIQAYDAQGNFKGLRYVVERLGEAQHKLSQKDFTAAAAKAFGKPALAGAVAIAHQGTESYDALSTAIGQTGAATTVAEAQGKGLTGAMLQLKTQSKQTAQTLYTALSPGLERVTRLLTSGMAKATPHLRDVINYARDLATLFGPGLSAKAHAGLAGLAATIQGLAGPLKGLAWEAAADGLHMLISLARAGADVLRNLAHGLDPVLAAIGDLASGADGGATALDILVTTVDLATDAISGLSGVLVPIGAAVGGLVHAFGGLPGPVQTAVMAMLLTRRVAPMLAGLATTVRGNVTGAWRTLGDQMRVQTALGAAAGQSIGRIGAAMAVLQVRVPILGRMTGAFRNARAAAGATGTAMSGLRTNLMAASAALRPSSWRAFNDQLRVQRSLADRAGVSLSRFGAGFSVIESRIPVVGRMSAAYRVAQTRIAGTGGALGQFTSRLAGATAAASTGMIGLRGAVAGTTAAIGVGLRGAMGGLMGAMGGPWGVALMGLTVGLGMLASAQQRASAEAEKHRSDITALTQAFRDSSGAIT